MQTEKEWGLRQGGEVTTITRQKFPVFLQDRPGMGLSIKCNKTTSNMTMGQNFLFWGIPDLNDEQSKKGGRSDPYCVTPSVIYRSENGGEPTSYWGEPERERERERDRRIDAGSVLLQSASFFSPPTQLRKEKQPQNGRHIGANRERQYFLSTLVFRAGHE
jgi:hypothetical protein